MWQIDSIFIHFQYLGKSIHREEDKHFFLKHSMLHDEKREKETVNKFIF